MEFVCSRCDQIARHRLYRVTAEEDGVVMLNMLVCASCARLARRLQLNTVKIEPAQTAMVSATPHD